MTYDFHTHYPFFLQPGHIQLDAYRWLAGDIPNVPAAWREVDEVKDPVARLDLLAQAINTPYRDRARMGIRPHTGGYRRWVEQDAAAFLEKRLRLMRQLGIVPTLPDPAHLPPHAWALQLPFTLQKPYISRDDQLFHILDNPLKRERVFKVPYIAASQWKGALRAAFRKIARDTATEIRLFGNEKGEDEHFQSGFLHFFPTFFDRLGLEVLNPHDRKTNVGKRGPILFECVPVGAKGVIQLLYVPLSPSTAQAATASPTQTDLQATARALRAMLTQYGFGAKTSSGYGLAYAKAEDAILNPDAFKETFIKAWNQYHV
ncbi:MAG: RAMP superfamily CRISPR-associated protein [Saprospiraceae bacterium]|nr:RAMP superfamily CRISPR-associated protein [Saprospiraceae bacterium]MDW8484244.1 RAMP superfamily CRISPR-associated protein [Saprospiraceae bacterium]